MSKVAKVFAVMAVVLLAAVLLFQLGVVENRPGGGTGVDFEPTLPALKSEDVVPTLSGDIRVLPVGTAVTGTLSLTVTPVHIEQVDEDVTQ